MGSSNDAAITAQRTRPGETIRMKWGLASRLPRWRMFDGRQSRLAPPWATLDGDETVGTVPSKVVTTCVKGRRR